MTSFPNWQVMTTPLSARHHRMDSQQPQLSVPATEMGEAEPDAQAAAIDVPDDTGEGGRLRMIVQLVRRSFGVKDLAAM